MRKLSKKSLCLAAAALALTAGISAGTAMAYFTTYAEASRSIALDMPGFSETDTIEKFSNWTKHVAIQNKGDSACYVRVKAYAGEKYQNNLKYEDGKDESILGENQKLDDIPFAERGSWTLGSDGYYYYTEVVEPGQYTHVLDIIIPVGEDDKDSFNVVVVQESTNVEYKDGKAKSWSEVEGWEQKAEVVPTTEG